MRDAAAYWAATLMAACFTSTLLASTASASAPMLAKGDVGNTSYVSLPFQKQVYDLCFNCSPNLAPAELFFEANPKSPFNDKARMAQTREDAVGKEKAGIVPSAGIQRWEATFAASFPKGTFTGEPDWVDEDRNKGFAQMPEFVAWRDWIAVSMRRLGAGDTVLPLRPDDAGIDALGRIARQIELMAGAMQRIR